MMLILEGLIFSHIIYIRTADF